MTEPRKIPFRGLEPAQAPAYLQSYLDCVDGAMAIGGRFGPGGRVLSSSWALFRGGEHVASIEIDMTEFQ